MAGQHEEAAASTAEPDLVSTSRDYDVRRLLEWTARFFDAEHAVLLIERADRRPLSAAYGLQDEHAHEIALHLLSTLRRESARTRVWTRADATVPVSLPPIVIAARPDSERLDDGLLAVLGAHRAERFDVVDAGGLCHLLACNAGAIAEYIAQLERLHANVDERTLRLEHLERVNRHLERHSRRLERNLASRTRYFAALSHELRTPLNAILGYNQLLEQGIFGGMSGDQADILRKIGSSARQLLTLVNDILDLSKIDAGKVTIDLRPTDVHAVVADASDAIAPQARQKGLEIIVSAEPGLPVVRTDPDRIRQILLNLLANAVKFTDEGSVEILVRHLRAHEASEAEIPPQASPPGADGWIHIAVRDTGIGIPEHKLDTIFDEFAQAGPLQTRSHGTGLGLAIAHRLARNLGGALTVRSTLGVESIFNLFLPCPAERVEADRFDR